MNTIEPYYSSLSDCCWFAGNILSTERQPSTWFIDSSGFRSPDRYWKFSVSEHTPSYTQDAGVIRLSHRPVTITTYPRSV